MQILTASQMRELDNFTLEQQRISSVELMFRAADACANWIFDNIDLNQQFSLFCGTGNNGGDGWAIGQLLLRKNCKVVCYAIDFSKKKSDDNQYYRNRYEGIGGDTVLLRTKEDLERVSTLKNNVLIDAVFGYGLNRPLEGLYSELIAQINALKTKAIIAVDIPSGMFCDELNEPNDAIVNADITLTFHSPKWSFFFPEAGNNTGKVETLDIGLAIDTFPLVRGEHHFIAPYLVKDYLPKRPTFSHKGTFGHVNVIAGSKGKMGAAVFMTKAAGYSGAGLVTATIPSVGLDVLQINVPNAMCDTAYGNDYLEKYIVVHPKMTYGIGCGIGTNAPTVEFVFHFFKNVNSPIIIDADALNILALHPELWEDVPKNSILTPHIGEFNRLTGESFSSNERLKKLKEIAVKREVIVILKDARTIIALPDGSCYFSLNGTSGMATGGSGDVLAGLLIGLMAQGISPENTAKLGVVLHGVAGEIATKKYTEFRMTATEILENVGNGLKVILGENERTW